MNFGKLYIVATPIGNLGDFTERGIDTLQEVEVIFCEDTRVTSKLLSHFHIDTHTRSYHQHSNEKRKQEILEILKQGKDVALVTDAGTPGISDPGNELISHIVFEYSNVEVVPIPGASAVVTALSICGFPTDKFLFLGFPPVKKKRNSYFAQVAESKYTVVMYESNHRIKKTLAALEEVCPEKEICLCRELTKKFETIYRGTVGEVASMDISEKGEFVIVVRS